MLVCECLWCRDVVVWMVCNIKKNDFDSVGIDPWATPYCLSAVCKVPLPAAHTAARWEMHAADQAGSAPTDATPAALAPAADSAATAAVAAAAPSG
jgi:hypothetical protein